MVTQRSANPIHPYLCLQLFPYKSNYLLLIKTASVILGHFKPGKLKFNEGPFWFSTFNNSGVSIQGIKRNYYSFRLNYFLSVLAKT